MDQPAPPLPSPASGGSEARTRSHKGLRPRPAATLIVVDRSRGGLKVLMGRRNARLAFMGGKFVFPGGRIEPGDRRMPVAGALSQRAEAALQARVARPSAALGRTLALAAIRETCEETGLVLGTREYGSPDSAPEDGAWGVFAEEGVLPDLESLHLVARAITPPQRPRRFDTRFFVTDRRMIAAERGGRVGPDSELTELAWFGLAAARRLDLPRITRLVLDDLECAVAGGFAPHLPIPFYFERYGKSLRELL